MNRPQRERDVADVRRFGSAQILVVFIAMAVEEWRKLVAEVAHALAGRRKRHAVIEEQRIVD